MTRLLRAALFGAGLLLLAVSTAHASTITCGFGGSSNNGPGCLIRDVNRTAFDFGAYQFDLLFNTVHGPFDVSVTNTLTSQAQLVQSGRLNGFPGYTCVPLDGVNCIDFEVNAPAPGANTWTGTFDLSIFWFTDTDPSFPNDPGNRIRILHNRGDVNGNGFDTDITIIGTYFGGCDCIDPGIGGRDDNFQSFLVAQGPAVPEPGTLLLLGSGVAWLVRRKTT
ncbi:MAG TPA: PEP-CTERM sorting domain-containing protein [Vicinamibacterales bacterium]|nr:PEP-CTERM sorting domain-containing protein [Vicinamibacterales bacterium]